MSQVESCALKSPDFWRHGKYLLPKVPVTSWRNPETAPRRVATIRELAAERPEQVCTFAVQGDVQSDCDSSHFDFHVVDGVDSKLLSAPRRPSTTHATSLRGGSSIGRACLLVSSDQAAVFESGFHFRGGADASRAAKVGFRGHLASFGSGGDLTARSGLPPKADLEGRVAAINNRAAHNYYHWLIEVAPRIAALDLLGIDVDRILIDCQSRFQSEVLRLLGVPDECILQPHCRMHVGADEMFYVSDASAVVLRHFAGMLMPERVEAPNRKLYISRRKAKNRRVKNELALERMLASRGFESVCFEDLTVGEQFALMRQSSVIVTTHGAALANTIFAPVGARVIEIFPRQRKNVSLYASLSHELGLRHSVVLGDYTLRKGIRVELRSVEAALDYEDLPISSTMPATRAAEPRNQITDA